MNKQNCVIGLPPIQDTYDSNEDVSTLETLEASNAQGMLVIQDGPLLWTGDWDHSNQV